MFQRLSNLLFGEVEEVAAELKGPNPCVMEADEEGWMLVNLPDSDCGMQAEDVAHSLPDSNQSNALVTRTRTECPSPVSHPPHKRRRTHKGRARDAAAAAPSESDPPPFCPSASASHSGAVTPPRRARPPTASSSSSAPSRSPGSGSECGGGRAGGPGRGCMDESWFVTPPPCFTAEGATAEASPMEDLLIEHPSMSVYVSPSNFSMVSNSGHLSAVGEESVGGLASSVSSRVAEPAAAARGTVPTRVSRGAAAQVGALAKVTQVARVQRGKARVERRHLGRNRIQRQNRTREPVPRHAGHARNTFLHQPSKRNICH